MKPDDRMRKIERIAMNAAMDRASENIVVIGDFNVLRHYLEMETFQPQVTDVEPQEEKVEG